MPTDTFPITADSNNGSGFWQDNTWANILTPSTFGDESSDAVVYVTQGDFGADFVMELSFFRWDTSSIPAAATITAANLLLYATTKVDGVNNLSMVGDYYDYGGSPTVVGDGIYAASPSIFSAADLGAITTSAVNTFALTDLTGIKRNGETNGQGFTGITGIRLTLSLGSGTPPTVDNHVQFASLASANQEPRLEVTYTVPSAGGPIAWIRA